MKCYKDNIFISVKLDAKRNKYYVATAYEVKQGKIESYVKSGRLNKVEINALDKTVTNGSITHIHLTSRKGTLHSFGNLI